MEEMTAFGTGRSAGAPSFFRGRGAVIVCNIFNITFPRAKILYKKQYKPSAAVL